MFLEQMIPKSREGLSMMAVRDGAGQEHVKILMFLGLLTDRDL